MLKFKVKSSFSILTCLFLTSTCFADKDDNSISDVSSNVNSLNTRKCGSLYISFPHVSYPNLYKSYEECFFLFFPSCIVEYKYFFTNVFAFSGRVDLNNSKFLPRPYYVGDRTYFSIVFSLELIYKRKGNKIFSGSFFPIGFCYPFNNYDKFVVKNIFICGFTVLKYENKKTGLYINFCHNLLPLYSICKCCCDLSYLLELFLSGILSIEFGFNIFRIIDKKKKINICFT